MAFAKKEPKEAPKTEPKAESSPPPTSEAAPAKAAGGKRELDSIYPAERKAFVSVGGKKFKVRYQTKHGSPVIGIDGQGTVDLSAWLAGKVDLKGLG